MKNAVTIALETSALSTLVKLLTAAGLVETVKNLHNATIFAPTNDAFALVPAETVASLLRPENKKSLQKILLTHVVPSEIFAEQISSGAEVRAVSGAVLEFQT
jgi:uncharacterized surface protein with fasciclin (FAS1) repeats